MDLSKISSKDLLYIKSQQLDKVSTEGLKEFKKQINIPNDLNNDIGDDARNFKLAKEPASVLTRLKMGTQDPFIGTGQLVSRGIDKILGKETEFTKQLDEFTKRREEQYAPVEGIDFARMGGNILNPLTFYGASKIPQVTGLGKKVALGAATGAGFAATTPVTGEDFAKEKSEQIQSGGVIGSLFPLGGAAIQRFISPKASQNAQLQLLKEEGINPTLGQILGGRADTYEEIATKLPIAGDIISKARNLNVEKFRESVLNKTLKPIGDKVPSNLKGREAIDYVAQKLDDSYTSTLQKIGAIKLDNTFVKNMSDLSNMINKSKLDKASKDQFKYMAQQIDDSINSQGFMTSEAYKELESQFSINAAKFGKSDSIYSDKLKNAAKQIKANLQDLLKRHTDKIGIVDGENLSAKLKNTNESWSLFKRVQKAAGAELAEFTPKQFNAAVKATDISKDKGNYARGKAIFQDFAEAGSSILGDKINTNPFIRATLNVGGLGLGIMNPTILYGLLGSGAVYNPYAQKAISKLLTSRPSYAPQLSSQAGKLVPYSSLTIPSIVRKEEE